jgi:hypothetical protein
MAKQQPDLINFTACLPAIAGVIKYDGQGGARITLEVPDTEIKQVNRLLDMRGQAFLVVISPLSE